MVYASIDRRDRHRGLAGCAAAALRRRRALPVRHPSARRSGATRLRRRARRFPRRRRSCPTAFRGWLRRRGYMQPIGSVRTFRDGCPPGPATDIAPSANGAAFQRVALDFFTAAAASLPNSFVSHSIAKATIAFSPCAERSRPNEPATSIEHSDDAADIGVQQRGPRRIALLDDDVVARKPERIARHLQRDPVIAAEAQVWPRHRAVRFGMSGVNLILPAASTLLDTVMMAARAAILPAGVSTVTSRLLQAMRLAGVDSDSGTCSPSLAIRVPSPWRQAIAVLRSCARALSIDGDVLQILAGEVGAEHEFRGAGPVAEILRQHRGAGDVALRARPRRWRGWRAPGRPEIPRFRRRARCGGRSGFSGPSGAVVISRPAPRASLIIGLVSGLCIQRAPRSNGTSKVVAVGLAAAADLARRLDHDHLAVRRHDAPRRSNAGSTRADHDNVGLARQRRRAGARRREPASPPGPRTPTGNRGGSLSCHGFRRL